MGMKTSCLGAHSDSLKKTLVARTHNLGAPGARAPVRQQPCQTGGKKIWAKKSQEQQEEPLGQGLNGPVPNGRGSSGF